MHTKRYLIAALALGYISVGCNLATGTTAPEKDSTKTAMPAVAEEKKVDSMALKFERKPFTYDSTKKYIYLTFDDGPHGGTKECMEVCRELGVKATFFMVGRHATDKWGKILVNDIKMSYPQFLLANHSYTHAKEQYKYFYQHPDISEADFYKAQDSLHVPYKIVRLPGNSAWVRKDEDKTSHLVHATCKRLDSAGYNVIGWDAEWNFTRGQSWPVQSPSKMAGEMMYAANGGHSHVKNHVVLLAHDRMFRTPAYKDSLTEMIKLLKQNPNYVFETIDNYPGLKF
jgi:peptidoglycan/xylan/chitin deacetylase (PgdA/CDA1 family)